MKKIENKNEALSLIKDKKLRARQISRDLLNDRNIGLALMKNDYKDYRHLSKGLRSDDEVLRVAYKTYKDTAGEDKIDSIIDFSLDVNLKISKISDKNMIITLLKNGYMPNYSAIEEAFKDKSLCMEAVAIDGSYLRLCSEKMQCDYDVVMNAVKHGARLQDIKFYKIDRNILMSIENKEPTSISYVPKEFRNDKKVLSHLNLL